MTCLPAFAAAGSASRAASPRRAPGRRRLPSKAWAPERSLHAELLRSLAHLHAVDERGAAADGDRDVERLGHLLEIGAFLLAVLRVGVDAVRALDGMRHRERDEALLARRERSVREHRAVVLEELLPERGAAFGYLREISKVLGLVVGV